MSLPRSTITRLLRRLGLICVRTHHLAAPYLLHPPLTSLDSTLLRLFPDLHGLRFLQIGANDGLRADPIHSFIDAHAWRGLMVEPLSSNFAALRRNRAGQPGISLLQAAVDLTSGHRTLYDLSPSARAKLPDWAGGLASFSHARVIQAATELGLNESSIVTEDITTVTWDQVWQSFGDDPCDLLIIDTEGYDIPLLRAAGLASRRPRIVHFEHACSTPEDRFAFYRELLDLGYELASDGPDTTAWLKR